MTQASEKTNGKYREWLVALSDCSKAVLSARAEEAAAKEKVAAAETDLQLFLKEADDVLSVSAPAKHHRRRSRRERPAGEEQEQARHQEAGLASLTDVSRYLLQCERTCEAPSQALTQGATCRRRTGTGAP